MSSLWPDLTALPGVSAAVEQARDAVAALTAHPVNRRGWATSAAAAAIRAARSSAALDGADPRLGGADVASVADPVLAGAIRVGAEIATLAPVFPRAPMQAIARLHTLAADGLVPAAELGRPRGDDPALGPRLTALSQMVTGSGWPAPVVAALVHAEILAARPFTTANGVVARGAGRLAAVAFGFDRHALAVPEVAFFRAGAAYRQLAEGYRDDRPGALRDWLLFVCGAFVDGAREGRSIAEAGRAG